MAIAAVAGHIGRAGRDRDRIGERHILPAAGCLIRESCAGEQCPVAAPQRSDVGPRIANSLVVLETGNQARLRGIELHAKIDAGRVWVGEVRRGVRVCK